MEPQHWQIQDFHRWPANAPNSEFVEFHGRPSLHVASGIASVSNLCLRDGVLEAEVAPDPHGAFFGLAFRTQSAKNFELIYFRPGFSGTKEAVQYAPVLNAALTWQLFHGEGSQARADFALDQWMRVRIEIAGRTATLYLNNDSKPALVVPDLAQGDSGCSIGFWGLFGGGYLSSLTFASRAPQEAASARASPVAGVIKNWQISHAFDVAEADPAIYPRTPLQWQSVNAEDSGRVILNRYRESPEIMPTPPRLQMAGLFPGSKVVFARASIRSDRDETRAMWFGYSDEAVVYVNGKLLFNGKNAWRFRDEGSGAGLMDYNDRLFLPLRKGRNELMVAVTEFMGGWGFECKLENEKVAAH